MRAINAKSNASTYPDWLKSDSGEVVPNVRERTAKSAPLTASLPSVSPSGNVSGGAVDAGAVSAPPGVKTMPNSLTVTDERPLTRTS